MRGRYLTAPTPRCDATRPARSPDQVGEPLVRSAAMIVMIAAVVPRVLVPISRVLTIVVAFARLTDDAARSDNQQTQ